MWHKLSGMSLHRIYTELQPMYTALHAYVRRNLQAVYGAENINITGKSLLILYIYVNHLPFLLRLVSDLNNNLPQGPYLLMSWGTCGAGSGTTFTLLWFRTPMSRVWIPARNCESRITLLKNYSPQQMTSMPRWGCAECHSPCSKNLS